MSFKNKQPIKQCPTLILMCGLPASGKTTYGRKLAEETGIVRFCPDEWKADLGIDFFDEEARTKLEARLWSLAQQFLKLGHSVILENGFWGRTERVELRQQAAKLGADSEIHFFDVPFEELIRRLKIRNKADGYGTVPLTRAHMEDYAKRFQAPNATELALFTKAIVHTAQDGVQRHGTERSSVNHVARRTNMRKSAIETISANEIAEEYLAALKSLPKLNIIGLYLYGSLVSGDFNEETSDIDLLIVIDHDVNPAVLTLVNNFHASFFASHEAWQTRFDVAYISENALRNFKTQPSEVIVGSGDEPLTIVEAPEYYLIDWYKVQEHSLALYGPKATILIPHISAGEFSQVIYNYMHTWRDGVGDAKNRGAQAYIILTLSRSLYAYKFAKHVSKRIGAEWAKSEYPEWSVVIDTALKWSRIDQKDDINDEAFQKQTAEFVQFILEDVKH